MCSLARRFAFLLSLLVLVACGGDDRSGLAPDIKHELSVGAAYASRLAVAGHRGVPDDESVIALGYLERLRLGLGSPFRLVDYALHDPRLGDDVRVPLAWAMLGRTLNGDAYRIDPAALDRVGASEAGFRAGVGRYHLEMIQAAVAEAVDPRAGELAVRLAYSLAAAEGTVWRGAPRVVAQAAALARDRELAREDARDLLRAARLERVDPIDLLVQWRAERRFRVEAPRLGALPPEVESDALAVAPRLAAAVRQMRPRLEGLTLARHGGVTAHGSTPLLGPAAAERLLVLADSADMPPETPVVVAVGTHSQELTAAPELTDDDLAERRALVEDAGDEERFAARMDRALDRQGDGDQALAATRLSAAAALRSYAQEEVWFPGFGGPSTRELADRFGVSVSFDKGVPGEWRPYYRRMLGQALSDLQRVLPAPDFRGLRVRFGRDPLGSRVLALHEPGRRILYLPPATSAGTIAHELAHDLDWQVAVKRYDVRGDYATDLAARRSGDRLASSLEGLVGGAMLLPPTRDGGTPNHLRRPAEAFARNVEWFVAVSLARQGIMDGYLSSVQDDVLTGYGSVLPPDLSGSAGRALIDILDAVAPVYPDTRDWYLRVYGPGRVLSPFELLRRVLETPVSSDVARDGAGRLPPPIRPDSAQANAGYPSLAGLGFKAVERARTAGQEAIDSWICSAPGAIYDRETESQRRDLVALAAAARARGIATRLAGRAAGREGAHWMQRRLYGAPWPSATLDSAATALLEPLADAAAAVDTTGFARPVDEFDLIQPSVGCPSVPLAPRAGAALLE